MTGTVPDPAEQPLTVDIDDFLLPADPADPAPEKRPGKAKRTRKQSAPAADDADEQAHQPLYKTADAWFKGWFHQLIERQVSVGLIWCPQWWRHGEAINILDALWTSWEGARVSDDPDAMLIWWERAIGMLNHLTSAEHGPFAACSSRQHQVEPGDLALPNDPAPAGYFGLIIEDEPDDYGTQPWTEAQR
jgi:hypothetical protein